MVGGKRHPGLPRKPTMNTVGNKQKPRGLPMYHAKYKYYILITDHLFRTCFSIFLVLPHHLTYGIFLAATAPVVAYSQIRYTSIHRSLLLSLSPLIPTP